MSSLLSQTCEIDVAPLRNALGAVTAAVPRRTPKPILYNVRLDVRPDGESSVTATDLDVSVRVRLIGVKADKPFSVLLNPNRITPILARTQGMSVSLELGDARVTLRGSGYKFELVSEDPDLYPVPPVFPAGGYHEILAADLRRLIRCTRYATDEKSDRYALGGCLMEPRDDGRFALVGTDGRRLAVTTCAATAVEGGGFANQAGTPVLPLKALALLERNLEDEDPPVRLAVDGRAAYVTSDRVSIQCRLLEGRYPRYQDVFPGPPAGKAEIESGELLDRVMLASVTTSEESKGVDFTLDGGLLGMKATAADVGASEVEMALAYDGPRLEFTLSPQFLTDMLTAVGPHVTLSLEVVGPKTPVVLKDAEFAYVIMPITRPD